MGTPCNNSACENEVMQARQGPPRAYCSEKCRWDCCHNPSLRRSAAPRLKHGLKLGARVTLACTVDDELRIHAAAHAADVSISDWVRGIVLAHLDGTKP